MNSLNINVAAIGRFAATTALAASIAYGGTHYSVSKYTPDGATADSLVYEWKTESGGSIGHIDELGKLSVSGAVLTGTGITIGDKDGAGCTQFSCLNGTCGGVIVTCP